MSQTNVNYSDNPTGPELMDDYLDKDQENRLTTNSGIQRPTYAKAGTFWINNSANPWILYFYNGSVDIPIGTIGTGSSGTFNVEGVDLSNYVDKSTNQTIGGDKTFTGYIKGQAIDNTNHAFKLGMSGVDYMDFYEYGGLWNFYQSRSNANTLVAKIGALTSGTNDETLATTNWVNSPTLSTNVVHRTGDETVGGTKTFTNAQVIEKSAPRLYFDNTDYNKNTAPSGNKDAVIVYRDSTDKWMGMIRNRVDSSLNGSFTIGTYKQNTASDVYSLLENIYQADGNYYLNFSVTPGSVSDTNLSLKKSTTSTTDTTIPCMGWVNSRLSAVKGNVSVASPSNLTSSISIGTRYTFANNGLFVLTIQVKGQTNPAVEVRMSNSNNASSSSQIITIFGENGGSAEYFQGPFIFPVKKGQSIYLNKTGTGSASIESAYLFSWNNS